MKNWAFVLFMLCGPTLAEGFRIDINLASKHLGGIDSVNYNERNYGFGIEYRLNEKYHLMAGEYGNSINDQSYYAGFGRLFKSASTEYFWGRYEIGAELGIANGYDESVSVDGKRLRKSEDYNFLGGDYFLMGGPYLRLGETHALKIRYMIVLATAGYQYEF